MTGSPQHLADVTALELPGSKGVPQQIQDSVVFHAVGKES